MYIQAIRTWNIKCIEFAILGEWVRIRLKFFILIKIVTPINFSLNISSLDLGQIGASL